MYSLQHMYSYDHHIILKSQVFIVKTKRRVHDRHTPGVGILMQLGSGADYAPPV